MATAPSYDDNPPVMSESDYLTFEKQNPNRHEFVDGRVYAMTGASVNHNLINTNIAIILGSQLKDRSCFLMSNDMRLRVQSQKVSYRYPDAMVIYGSIEVMNDDDMVVTNPVLIMEILSSSTALTDYNDKLREYTQIESLQDYILIAQDAIKVDRFSRQASGDWTYSPYSDVEDVIEIAAIDCQMSLRDVYDKVLT